MKSFSSFLSVGLLAMLLLALRPPSVAQVPAWQSARAVAGAAVITGSIASEVLATAVDAVGNVYLAGRFTNTVVLGSTTLISSGDYDMFVAKFNPVSNQFVWAQRAGGTGGDYATALAVSGTSVYVAGVFGSTSSFGPVILTSVANTSDAFVAKLTDVGSTGSFVWAQRAGGTGGDYATALATSGNSVYVAGSFDSPIASFGLNMLTNADVGAGTSDAFVAKLTDAGSTGNFVWSQRVGGTGYDEAAALAVNGNNVYVAGYFRSSTVSFGPTTLATAGLSDAFVTKLMDAGSTFSFAWAQRVGGTSYDEAVALAVSGNNVYVTGYFQSYTASFGAVTLTNMGFGSNDAFVTKLTDAGSFVWAQRAGGTLFEIPTALAVSGTNVYVVGRFDSSTAGFGPTILTNIGYYDAFVAKLTDAGSTASFVWAERAGELSYDGAYALAVSGTSVYMAGYFQSPTMGFGTITLSNPNATPLGFLATLNDPTLTATTPGHPLTPVQLFPNPAHHTATLGLPAGTAPAPLVLTDALGRAVRRYPAPAGPEATLDLQDLPAGLYLLHGSGPVQRLAVE